MSNAADKSKILALSAGFLAAARLFVPARLGLALALTPIVNNLFFNKPENSAETIEE